MSTVAQDIADLYIELGTQLMDPDISDAEYDAIFAASAAIRESAFQQELEAFTLKTARFNEVSNKLIAAAGAIASSSVKRQIQDLLEKIRHAFEKSQSSNQQNGGAATDTDSVGQDTDEEDLEDPDDTNDDNEQSDDVAEEPIDDEPGQDDDQIILPDPGTGNAGTIVLNEAHLLALWKRSQYPVYDGGLIVFGIRSCLPVDYAGTEFAKSHEIVLTQLNYQTMRCTIGLWDPGKGFALYPGSTVPELRVVRARIPFRGNRVNQLGRGRYKRYDAGWHKRSEGRNGHWALLQESDTTHQRTANDDEYDLSDRWEIGRPGDNIHCAFGMNIDGRIPDHKYSSAGCQVIAGTVRKVAPGSESGPWKKFISHFAKAGGQKQTEYILFDASEVMQMVRNRYANKSVILRFGSQGKLVSNLQETLGAALDREVRVDGDFGASTFQAVLDFQREHFGDNADDGIIGVETAEKLQIGLPTFDFANAISGGKGYVSSPPAPTEEEPDLAGPVQGEFITKAQFKEFCARPSSGYRRTNYDSYIKAFTSNKGKRILAKYGISKTKNRMAHFFAQAAHETGSFNHLREALTYTKPATIRRAWPSRTRDLTDAWISANLVRNPEALANWAYNGRLGNRRNTNDGFIYRGGGTFQLTGRSNYRDKGDIARVELENNPSLIEDGLISLEVACAYWDKKNCNALADANAIEKISRGINRGNVNSNKKSNGEADRINKYNKLIGILT